jgi:hypothetical protein
MQNPDEVLASLIKLEQRRVKRCAVHLSLASQRKKLIDFFLSITCTNNKLYMNVFFGAVWILDKTLEVSSTVQCDFLLGLCCLSLASKYYGEEKLLSSPQTRYDKKTLNEAELTVLAMIDFNVHCPNLQCFTRVLDNMNHVNNSKIKSMTYHLLIAAVYNPYYLDHRPCILAATGIIISSCLLQEIELTKAYVDYFAQQKDEVLRCITFMKNVVKNHGSDNGWYQQAKTHWNRIYFLDLILRETQRETVSTATQTESDTQCQVQSQINVSNDFSSQSYGGNHSSVSPSLDYDTANEFLGELSSYTNSFG